MSNCDKKMFYETTSNTDEIGQGDIFLNIPRCIDIEFENVMIIENGKEKLTNIPWGEIIEKKMEVAAVLGVTPTPAIVATQKCDAQQNNYITLCEIVRLTQLKAFQNLSIKKKAKELVQKNREMPGIFYLAPNETIEFTEPMVVDFSSTIKLKREDLEKFKSNRKARLNDIAREHFREKLSHFFHRYAWNEWYILNKDEISQHKLYSQFDKSKLYDWQK